MKVGDLVRHSMFSKEKAPSMVLSVCRTQIRIFDPTDGHIWFVSMPAAKEYEVISESR